MRSRPRARPRLQVAGQMSIFDPGGNSACTTRTDGFSAASERTAFASRPPVHGTDGARQTSTPTVSKTNTYDTANRIRNTGYTYDDLGRTVTTPAAEPASGANACLAPRTEPPRSLRTSRGGSHRLVSRSFFCSREKKLSMAALSPLDPTRPIDTTRPLFFNRRTTFFDRN